MPSGNPPTTWAVRFCRACAGGTGSRHFPSFEGIGSAPAYWRDGGTIDAYWEAHIDLLDPQADFQLSQSQEPLCVASAQGPTVILRREVTAPWALVAWLGDAMQEEVRAWVRSERPHTPGQLGPGP
jgi:ADP-glucose pyrophosphorylase